MGGLWSAAHVRWLWSVQSAFDLRVGSSTRSAHSCLLEDCARACLRWFNTQNASLCVGWAQWGRISLCYNDWTHVWLKQHVLCSVQLKTPNKEPSLERTRFHPSAGQPWSDTVIIPSSVTFNIQTCSFSDFSSSETVQHFPLLSSWHLEMV